MTDEEFLNEMFPYYEDMTDLEVLQTASRRVGAEKMAKWKEEQMIKKACEWLESNLCCYDENYRGIDSGNSLIEDFKQAMEE